jgi:hypothetical protein
MDYNIDENQRVFAKTDKISPDRFWQFTKNRSGQFEIFKTWEILKKRKPKKPGNKSENLSDKLEKLVALPFSIKNGWKTIDKTEKTKQFSVSPLKFRKLNFVRFPVFVVFAKTGGDQFSTPYG